MLKWLSKDVGAAESAFWFKVGLGIPAAAVALWALVFKVL